ncbi:MAG: Gldg family protein, partial [Planctomycetota bacterium]|nr:Gldg family protein [Planctomycetota bacterium]
QLPAWPILQLVEQRYEVRDLDPATLEEVPADIDLLLLIQPKGLTEAGLYAIDQFALAGGKICAFVDPVVLFDPAADPEPPAPGAEVTGMDSLLAAWGVPLKADKVAGDDVTGTQIRSRTDKMVRLPMFFNVSEEGLSDDDILTEALTSMRMLMAGAFEVAAPEGLTVTTLAATSAEGGGTVGRSLVTQRMDEETLAASFVNQGTAQTLGVRLRGEVASAFPDGAPAPAPTEGEEAPGEPLPTEGHLTASSAPLNAIVMADVDMLHENLWAQRVQSLFGGVSYRSANGNAPFLVGALENLSGSDDLISLRSREAYRRPFLRKEELEREAQEAFAAQEQALEQKLAEAERKINELQAEKDPQSASLLSPEQQAEIDRFRVQEVETRRELRKVKRDLKADIEALGTRLELLNIALIPALIAAFGAATWLFRRRSSRA